MKYLIFICAFCLLTGCQPSEKQEPEERIQPVTNQIPEEVSDNTPPVLDETSVSPPETVGVDEKTTKKITSNLPETENKTEITEKTDPVAPVSPEPETNTGASEKNDINGEKDIQDVTPLPDPKDTKAEDKSEEITPTPEKVEKTAKEQEKNKDPETPDNPEKNKKTENLKNNEKKTGEKTKETTNKEPKRPEFYVKYLDLLKEYVDKEGNVDYMSLRRKRAELLEIVRASEKINISIEDLAKDPENEQIAFWINVHNVFTLKLVIDNYPIKRNPWLTIMYPDIGIMHIPGGRDKVYFNILSEERTLREIEKEILMNNFKDLRIPFTLTYATAGGAFLRNEPYYPDKLDKQLDEQVKRYLSSPKGMKIDKYQNILYLADIFIWYKQYFIEQYSDIKKFRDRPEDIRSYLNFIINYIPQEDVHFLENTDFDVKYMKYDWKLNEQ